MGSILISDNIEYKAKKGGGGGKERFYILIKKNNRVRGRRYSHQKRACA